MAINFIKKEDLSHITRTTRQWETTIDRYEIIPKGVLCIELCNDKLTKIKIGNGHLIYEQLPYVSDVNLSDYYTKEETNNLIKDLKAIKIKGEASSLSDLPLRGNEEGDLWFVSKSDPDEHSRYDEYVWYKNKWESFGSSDIDLSEYAKKSYVDTHIQEVQDEITEIIESGYLHKHSNKDILDHTSAVYNVEKDNKLRDLHNYDDTELREKAHTHLNKNILDQTDAVYNRDKDDKLSSLHNYDDTDVKDRISTLEGVAHSHSNQDILNRTTAAFTKEQALQLLDCKDFEGTDGVHDGRHGFVPAPTASDAGKVLGANGQWVEGGSSGGDVIAQGGGIEITTDAQTGVKTVSVNAGTGLDIDQQTGELYVTSTGGDSIAEGNGIDITTDSQTGVKTISVDIGNGLQFNQNSEIDINTGDGLSINNSNAIELDKATTTTIGGVIVGDNLSIDNTGTLSADEYTPGEGISIDSNKEVSVKYNSDGLSINASDELELDKATKNSIGGVIVGDNIDVTNGTISVPIATDSSIGVVKPTDGLSVDNTGELSVNVGDALSIDSTDNDINVNVGDGLQINQDNEIEVSLGNGLQFDSNDDIEVNTGDGLSVNQDNELEVNIGDGLTLDANEKITIDEDIVPLTHYFPGTAISFDQQYSAEEIDIWNNGNGWANGAYINSTGNSYLDGYSPEYHSPIGNNSLEVPTNANRIRVIALSTNDDLLNVTVHCLDASYNRYLTLSDDTQPYDNWFDLDASARYVNFGIRWTLGSNVNISAADIKSVTLYWRHSGSGDLDVDFMNINVNYGDGLSINQDNELEVNVGDGLSVDSTNNDINVKTGRALSINSSTKAVDVDIASDSSYGCVKIGEGIDVDQYGIISVDKMVPFRVGNGLELVDESVRLPSAYARVEYVENTVGGGWALINSLVPSYVGTSSDKSHIIARLSKTAYSSSSTITYAFGRWDNYNARVKFAFGYHGTSLPLTVGYVYGRDASWNNADVNGGRATNYELNDIIDVDLSAAGLKIDNELIHTVSYEGPGPISLKFGVFRPNTSGTPESGGVADFRGRIYSLKLYDDQVLIFNLVPCVQKSSSIVGFYDSVGDAFYPSVGDNPFETDMSTMDIDVADWVMNVTPATTDTIGGIKVGSGLSAANDGTLSVNVGDGLFIDLTNNDVNVKIGQALSINNSNEIDVKYGNGLTVNQNNELEVVGGGGTEYRPGKAIEFNSTLKTNQIRIEFNDIRSYTPHPQTGSIYLQLRSMEFADDNLTPVTITSGTAIWSDGSEVTYASANETLDNVINDNGKMVVSGFNGTKDLIITLNLSRDVPYDSIKFFRYKTGNDASERDPIGWKIYANDTVTSSTWQLINEESNEDITTSRDTWTRYYACTFEDDSPSISVKYDNGLTVNSDNELEVFLSKGLEFDPNVTETMVADEMYLFASNVSCQVHTDNPTYPAPTDRTYQKTTTEPALCCIWEVGDSGYLWTGPLIVGLTQTSVQYTTQDRQQTVTYQNTFTYLGKTWYTSGYPDFLNNADHEDKLGNLQYIGSYTAVTDQIQAAKDLIDLANVQFVSNAGIQAKLGNGLQFDENNAIEVTGGGSSYTAGEGIDISPVSSSELIVDNQEYYFDSQVTCEIHGDFNRTFQKTTAVPSLGVIWKCYDGGNLWGGPLFVGLTADAVKYTSEGTTYNAKGTFSYLDRTWYYSDTSYFVRNPQDQDFANHLQVFTEAYPAVSDIVQAAKDLIDAASLVLNIDRISVKCGDGLTIVDDEICTIPYVAGEGISIDENNVVSSTFVYEEGQGITFETSGSTDSFDVKNKEYYFDDIVSCQLNGDYGPRTFTRVSTDPCLLAIVQATANGVIWSGPLAVGLTENSAKYSNSYDGTTLGPNTSFDYKGYTWYLTYDYGLMNSTGVDLMGNVPSIDMTSIDTSDRNNLYLLGQALIDTAELIQTVVSMDVWGDGNGWTNGDYYNGTSDTFNTDWYYTYHYNHSEYIPVPEGALKVRVIGISNENDSHFEGGGVNAFDSNHHHTHWIGCCTATDEWVEIPEGVVYVQPNVKWNNNNTRTISSSDIKSVTLQFWYSDPKNNAITTKLGDGLTFDENDAITLDESIKLIIHCVGTPLT